MGKIKTRPFSPAFSLVELLIVVAVMGLLLALSVPAFTNISREMAITRASQDLADAIILARQEAATRNRKAFVRLIKLPDTSGNLVYRGVQSWIIKDDSGTLAPLGRVITFPDGVMLSEESSLSPLAQTPFSTNGTMTVAGVSRDYSEFSLLASGGLESTGTNSFLTVIQRKDANSSAANQPANFVSVFVNSLTGEVSTFQP